MSVLLAKQVSKRYGAGEVEVEALKAVDLNVERGEFLAIMGPSGCGKSTLLHVLGGIDPPTCGEVFLDGQDLAALDDAARSVLRRRRLGFVFQRINLLPTLTASENVSLPLRIDGVGRGDSNRRAQAALERVRMAHRRAHFPHELSGGEQQRVAIARALVIEPAVLFADEPTGALDSTNAGQILGLLGECVRDGQTVLMVTHDVHMARHATRLLLMQDGRIVETAETAGAAEFAQRWGERP
jgi:putative ABC transport system ATP-binding protein